jgi:hypothetical protein
MNGIWRIALILILVPVFGNHTALGQGTKGENQFRQQIQNACNQVGTVIQQGRGVLAQAGAQGINTSAAQAALNRAQSMCQSMLQNPALWSQQQPWSQQQGNCPPGTLEPIDPFGDYLFKGVCIGSSDGKFVPRSYDPTGLVARAQQWAQDMATRVDEWTKVVKAVNNKSDNEKESFLAEKNAFLKSLGLGTFPSRAPQSPGDQAVSDLESLKQGGTSTPPISLSDDEWKVPKSSSYDVNKSKDTVNVPYTPPPPSELDSLLKGGTSTLPINLDTTPPIPYTSPPPKGQTIIRPRDGTEIPYNPNPTPEKHYDHAGENEVPEAAQETEAVPY